MRDVDHVSDLPYRRAALALHGLPPADQRWVLDQLPEDQRARLQSLVDELVVLGVPAELAAEAATDGADTRHKRPSLSPEAVAALLRDEPLPLVAAAAHAIRDECVAGLIDALDPAQRHALAGGAAARAGRTTVHVQGVLAALLRAQVPSGPPVAGPTRSVGSRWRLRWRT